MAERHKPGVDAASLVARSAYWHLKDIKPAAQEVPIMYPGKVESTLIITMLDLLGVPPSDIEQRRDFFRACTAFNLQWRAIDEVLDEKLPRTDIRVAEEDLLSTPVWHKYAGKMVTGQEGVQIALEAMAQMIPAVDLRSRHRRGRVEELLETYTKIVADNANNSNYHQGPTLPYDVVLRSRDEVTGGVARVGTEFMTVLLDIPEDQRAIEFFGGLNTVMQFGDDLIDLRKDWLGHNRAREENPELPLRPDENILRTLLLEYPDEMRAVESILGDSSRHIALWVPEVAPNAFDLFRERFQRELDKLPFHPRAEKLKGIVSLTFHKVLPAIPEPGFGKGQWFYQWARY